MRIKAGVNLDGVHFMAFIAAALYDYIRQANGLKEGTIVGGREPADSIGPARVRGSLHPPGRSVDLRTTDLPGGAKGPTAHALAQALYNALGADFDILVEEDHIHVEYAPRTFLAGL